jgi:hypothetical protein
MDRMTAVRSLRRSFIRISDSMVRHPMRCGMPAAQLFKTCFVLPTIAAC